jgi:hypothetical protein
LFERLIVPAVSFMLVNVTDAFWFPPGRMTRLTGRAVIVKLAFRTVMVNVSVMLLTLPDVSVVWRLGL